MTNEEQAIGYLKEAEDIISKHVDVFSPFEAMRLALGLRYLLAYIDNEAEAKQKNATS